MLGMMHVQNDRAFEGIIRSKSDRELLTILVKALIRNDPESRGVIWEDELSDSIMSEWLLWAKQNPGCDGELITVRIDYVTSEMKLESMEPKPKSVWVTVENRVFGMIEDYLEEVVRPRTRALVLGLRKETKISHVMEYSINIVKGRFPFAEAAQDGVV